MARILAIDYGTKRIGLAVTDPLQIIASQLETVAAPAIFEWLERYLVAEEVERIVLGEPFYPDGNPAQIHPQVMEFAQKIQEKYPTIPVTLWNEAYSSERAKQVLLKSGAKRKKRRDKSMVDKIAAALILQDYMEQCVWNQ